MMYQILYRMYQGCQSPFRGGERPPITCRWSPNKEMDHGKEDRCLVSSRIRCIKISQGCTQGSKVHFEVGNDLQSWTMGNKIEVSVDQGLDVAKFLNNVPYFLKDLLRVSEQGTTSNYFLKIPKEINEPWVIIQRSWQLMNGMYQIVLSMCQIL